METKFETQKLHECLQEVYDLAWNIGALDVSIEFRDGLVAEILMRDLDTLKKLAGENEIHVEVTNFTMHYGRGIAFNAWFIQDKVKYIYVADGGQIQEAGLVVPSMISLTSPVPA